MADDPVEAAEEGAASEVAEETPAEQTDPPVQEETGDESIEDADGSDPGDETGAHAKSDVKYSRFRSVNERRKAAEAEVQRLKGQLEALAPKPEPVAAKTTKDRLKNILKPAPADMPPLQQMEYYTLEAMQEHLPELLDSWFEAKMGMKPDAVAATIQHNTVATREQILTQFNDAAKTHGLDPTDETLKTAVGALMDTGKFRTFDEAMNAFRPKIAQSTNKVRRVNGKGAETGTLDVAGLSRVTRDILSKDEAMALAAKGVRVEQKSVTDILRAASK